MKNIENIPNLIKHHNIIEFLSNNKMYLKYSKDLDLTNKDVFKCYKLKPVNDTYLYIGKNKDKYYFLATLVTVDLAKILNIKYFIIIFNKPVIENNIFKGSAIVVDEKEKRRKIDNLKLERVG